MSPRPTIYIVNHGAHDFSAAEEWGALCFMTSGPINRYAVADMHRTFTEHLARSGADDYILPTSLGVMNMVACSIFAYRHGRLNLLLYKDGRYVERRIVL